MATTDASDSLFDTFPPVSDEAWRAAMHDDLGVTDPDATLTWDSMDGVSLRAYYRAADRDRCSHLSAVPLTRSGMTPANTWRLRQDIIHPDLATAQRHLQDAIAGGATDIGLTVNVKNDTLHGIPIQHLADLDTLLENVDLASTPIHATSGPAGLALWSMLHVLAIERDVAPAALRGSTDYDPLAALTWHQLTEAEQAFDLAAATVRQAAEAPAAYLLSVDLRPYHDAGASTVQTLGCALGALSEALVRLHRRDLAPSDVASTLQWIVPVDTSFFVGIAMLRALRLLIPQVLAAFDVDASPSDAHIQAVTSKRSEAAYSPTTNLLRSTTEAVAAVLGGCDMLTVRPFTAAAETPDDFALRLARNTQHILREEAHLDRVADPSAGAYYMEVMTDRLARSAWSFFQNLESEGGLLAALQAGIVQSQIAEVRAERKRRIAHRKHVLVGTNHYPAPDEAAHDERPPNNPGVPLQYSAIPADVDTASWLEMLQAVWRDGATLGSALQALEGAAASEVEPLPRIRLSTPFEILRRRTARYAAAHDGPPRVFLLPVGNPAIRSARANFARNVFGVAGFAIDDNLGFDVPEAGAEAAVAAGADVVVLCSTNDAYAEIAPLVCAHLRDAGSDALVVVAGYPSDQIDTLEAAGVDRFIHKRSPLLDTLEDVQQRLGIFSETKNRRNEES